MHRSICPDHEQHPLYCQLSLDGVQESKSSLNSLDVYSLTFNHCRNVYPIRIIKPAERFKYDEQVEFKRVLEDINANGITLDCAVFDNLKRSIILCKKNHAAKMACEYCVSCAVTYVNKSRKTTSLIQRRYEIQEQNLSQELSQLQDTQENPSENEDVINLRQTLTQLEQEKESEVQKSGKKQLTWPAETRNGTLRTLDGIRAIAQEIERNPEILTTDPDFCQGIKGKSLLLDQPRFNLLKDAPCEYMHLVCLGTVRRLVELTFKVGESRERATKRKLSPPTLFNDKMRDIQVLRKFPRRCRNLDFSVMKAVEFRNIILFYFTIVVDCIEDEFKDEKRVWLHLSFMVRACVLPNNEFRNVDDNDVLSACEKFYKLYEKVYGQNNCTYSIHVAASHMLLIRGHRPLTFKSAFKFESFFSEMKNLFHPGTVSSIKQVLQNCFVKRILENHYCEKTIFFSPEKKPIPGIKFNPGKENNSLIYTTNDDNAVKMYVIQEIIDENHFNCKAQGKFKLNFPLVKEYNWSNVGVFRLGPVSEDLTIINRKDISGKVIKVDNYLFTCPNNVLNEQ